jgi:hypothetical protein
MNEQNENRYDRIRNDLQNRVKARINRRTLTSNLRDERSKQIERKSAWAADFKDDPWTYVFMGISAVFTTILGIMLGLAPYQGTVNGVPGIVFHDDFIHVFVAIVYAAAFVAVTELAFIVSKSKFHDREDGNPKQTGSMLFMLILAGLAVIGTGIAGFSIGASVLGFLSDFKAIPHSAQKYVVWSIPVLIAVYGYCLTIYKLSSEKDQNRRMLKQMRNEADLEHELQMAIADDEAREMMRLAEISAYLAAVERGALTYGEAQAAMKAGKSLGQLEVEKGKDLDGNDQIGTVDLATVIAGFSKNGKGSSNP